MLLNAGYLKFNDAKKFPIWKSFLLPEYSSELLNPCLPEVMKIPKVTDNSKSNVRNT